MQEAAQFESGSRFRTDRRKLSKLGNQFESARFNGSCFNGMRRIVGRNQLVKFNPECAGLDVVAEAARDGFEAGKLMDKKIR